MLTVKTFNSNQLYGSPYIKRIEEKMQFETARKACYISSYQMLMEN